MKNLLLLFFTFLCLSVAAQKKIDGFYSGVLFNDSTKMLQKYELAIAEYRGKISGYSYVTFVSRDTFYWGIRKVKGEIVGDSLVVEDDKIVANNFPEAPAKRVGRVITIPLNGQDSLITLNGRWKTNQTKKYYSVPGSIDLDRSTDSANSPLINHLKELRIISEPVYAAVTETKVKVKEDKTKIKTEMKTETTSKTASKPLPAPVQPAVVNNKPTTLPYTERKNKLQQTIEAGSDSLILAFYDNGVVDGDSISVYLNGEIIIAKTKLLAVATKKTIAMPGTGDIELLLVAENLGTLPPNTGLITIKDGEKQYQVNFSADLQTNATIIIRRRKN